nr:hypothetical protein [Pectobacterium carotovorum]
MNISPRLSEPQPLPLSCEKHHPYPLFQHPNLLANCARRHVQCFSRSLDATSLPNLNKGAQRQQWERYCHQI